MADPNPNPPPGDNPTGDEDSTNPAIVAPSAPQPPPSGNTTGDNALTPPITVPAVPPPIGPIAQRARELAFQEHNKYKRQVDMGAAIGANRYSIEINGAEAKYIGSNTGTLGCYLDVKTLDLPAGIRVGLTNYHVIRGCVDDICIGHVLAADGSTVSREYEPPAGSTLEMADRDGFPQTWDQAIKDVGVTSPPIQRHKEIMQALYTRLLRINLTTGVATTDQRIQDQINWRQAFIDGGSHLLGKIFMASRTGRRSAGNGFLDWALISDIPSQRQGNNRIPDYSAWASRYDPRFRPPIQVCGTRLKHPDIRPLSKIQHGEVVFKVGAFTGPTAGIRVHPKKRYTVPYPLDKYSKNRPSDEHVIISCPAAQGWANPPFCIRGDSGSVVFNTLGEAVGVIWSSTYYANGCVENLIMDIQDVFEDVKAKGNGSILDIRVSMVG